MSRENVALPYRDEIRQCPKCMAYFELGLDARSPDAKLRYCADCKQEHSEHWHRKCWNCGYQWLEQLAYKPQPKLACTSERSWWSLLVHGVRWLKPGHPVGCEL